MEFIVITLASLIAAAVTLVSGFGLGSVLLPVFALFMPVPVAIAATAVVHLANNLFKLALVGKQASRPVVKRFGIPAVIAAVAGASLMTAFGHAAPLAVYQIGNRTCEVTLVKLVIAVVIVGFSILEFIPAFTRLKVDPKYLPLGGVISGFFGGLSGHQGALRSAFLIRADLTKAEFVGTGVVIAVLVDITRLIVYGFDTTSTGLVSMTRHTALLVASATVAALAGSLIAARLVEKITLRAVQVTVAVGLALIGLAMGAGVV